MLLRRPGAAETPSHLAEGAGLTASVRGLEGSHVAEEVEGAAEGGWEKDEREERGETRCG